ncbi:hypothetical protein GA0115240_11339 [Streptomyces sp. DvalAA-14]|uniref:hypothetical protein n=1 Tax=unclassified Streptomyces TaxID=2593676 RepID=UPI00081AFE17|nr:MULTISPECIES: hypothetical protein [unclassified Streptomyces]MYS19791.1 hypothetical protein [Streptomyces sp. SID4948]SCD53413.1 hypothetical protein GA0115240_11339 [Streptomyces sp. DvalAA-14]
MGEKVTAEGSVLGALKWALVTGVVLVAGALVPMLWGHATWPESRHALWVTVPVPVAMVIVVKLVLPWHERRVARRAAQKLARAAGANAE